jgi:photosystem II stability/assembly factor-like uncharacterized protein
LPVTAAVNGAAEPNVLEMYKTTDGGATWTLIVPEHAFGNTNASGWTTYDLYIVDVTHAWGTDFIGQVWGTSDGFKNWQLLDSKTADFQNGPNSDKTMYALSFVDASYGWGVSKTHLWHTTDGGRNWSEIVYHIAV